MWGGNRESVVLNILHKAQEFGSSFIMLKVRDFSNKKLWKIKEIFLLVKYFYDWLQNPIVRFFSRTLHESPSSEAGVVFCGRRNVLDWFCPLLPLRRREEGGGAQRMIGVFPENLFHKLKGISSKHQPFSLCGIEDSGVFFVIRWTLSTSTPRVCYYCYPLTTFLLSNTIFLVYSDN